MATLLPFRALRPHPDKIEAVSCPPYDVLTEDEARSLVEGNPYSFLRVKRPESQFPPGFDPHSDAAYEAAAQTLADFRREGILVQDETSAYFVYSQRMGDHEQTGIVGLASVDEYDNDTIKKHEKTRVDKEKDRTRHIVTTHCQYGPVFATFQNQNALASLMEDVKQAAPPEFEFRDEHGVVHRAWRVDASDPRTAEIGRLIREVPALYVADGHHRAKSASNARAELAAKNPSHDGTEPYNWFLTVLFPADQLQILSYNRVILSLGGRSSEEILAGVRGRFAVEEIAGPHTPDRGSFALYLGGGWFDLKPLAALPQDPVERLDASVLQRELLGPVFGISDQRTDKNIEFIGGIHLPERAQMRADENGGAAILMHPTSIEDVLDVSDAGEVMPPKSTWFEPKLRSGLFVYCF